MDLHTSLTFWLIRNGLLQTYPTLQSDEQTEVVVVGCGITGSLIAHRLTELGIPTIVIDKREVAWGSSAASTALLQYEIDTSLHELSEIAGLDNAVRIYRASLGALEQVSALCERLQVRDFARRSSFYFASKRSHEKSLQAEYELRARHDFPAELWQKPAIEQAFDMKARFGILSREAAEVDVYQFTHALLQDAIPRGLRVFDRTPLQTVERDATGVTVTLDGGQTIRARHLVLACGYETTQFFPEKVAKLNSSYAFVSEPLTHFSGWYERSLIWETARPYFYARTTADGRALIGGEDVPFRNAWARDALLDKKIARLLKRAGEIFPKLPLTVSYAWAGTFAETEDGLPYIGSHPALPHTSFAMCYGGNGIVYSMLAADIISASVQGQTHPYTELFAFQRPWH